MKLKNILLLMFENWYLISLNMSLILSVVIGVIILINSLLVILVRNPIHSVLYLILVFLSMGIFFLILGVEFLAFLLFIVYLGAIAVLFLFVIMMLNIRLVELKENIIRYLPLSSLIFILVVVEFFFLINNSTFLNSGDNVKTLYFYKNWFILLNSIDNIEVIGSLIYTYYIFGFLIAGVILLLAMKGTIILTLNQLLVFKRQHHYFQNRKNIYNSLYSIRSYNIRKFIKFEEDVIKESEEESEDNGDEESKKENEDKSEIQGTEKIIEENVNNS